MSWDYWDYNSTSSTTNTISPNSYWQNMPIGTCGGSTITNTIYMPTSSSPVYWYVSQPVIQRFIVDAPDYWDEQNRADFTRLINDETETGFTLEFWVEGKIRITDPTVQTRTMKDFLPLLKHRASAVDRAKIDAFFVAHPLDGPKSGSVASASDGSGDAGETEGLDPQGDSAVGESRGAHE